MEGSQIPNNTGKGDRHDSGPADTSGVVTVTVTSARAHWIVARRKTSLKREGLKEGADEKEDKQDGTGPAEMETCEIRVRTNEEKEAGQETRRVNIWFTKDDKVNHEGTLEHLDEKGYAIIRGEDKDEDLKELKWLRQTAEKEASRRQAKGWKTEEYGFKAGKKENEFQVREMSDIGREGAMIENIRKTVSENLGIEGDILKAVVVRCANLTTRWTEAESTN
jgi:hypothetical protein